MNLLKSYPQTYPLLGKSKLHNLLQSSSEHATSLKLDFQSLYLLTDRHVLCVGNVIFQELLAVVLPQREFQIWLRVELDQGDLKNHCFSLSVSQFFSLYISVSLPLCLSLT